MIEKIKELGAVPHPYGDTLASEYVFSMALINVDIEETDSVPTACIGVEGNRLVMKINPKFVESTCKGWASDLDKTAFIRALGKHELLHAMLKHTVRVEGYDPEIANIVQDALVNTIIPEFNALIEKGLLKPVEPEGLLEKNGNILVASETALRNKWTWEEYYNAIVKILKDRCECVAEKIQELSKDIKHGEVPVRIQEELSQLLEEFVQTLKQKGSSPGWLDRIIESERRISRRIKIRKTIRKILLCGTERLKLQTATRPNRRFQHLHGTRNYFIAPKITVLVDVSGSVSDAELMWAVGEIHAIARSMGGKFVVFTYDHGLRDKMSYYKIKKKGFKTKGGGGTDLNRALAELDEEFLKDSIVFVFTDGYDNCPDAQAFKSAKEIVYMLHKNHDESFENKARTYAKIIEMVY